MVGEKTEDTSLDKLIFNTMIRAKEVINIRSVLELIKPGDTYTPAFDLAALAADVTNIIRDLERKINFMNNIYLQETPNKNEKTKFDLGTKLWNSCRRVMDSGNLHYILVPNLIDFAYGRVLNHSLPTGEYLPQFINLDVGLINLPVQFALFTKAIKIKRRFTAAQTKRLLVFLSYLRASELDQELNIRDSYFHFEDAMAFCRKIPEKYRGILNIKKLTFSDDWRRYKLFLKEKNSEYYQLVEEIQTFEKNHPYLHRTMQVYILYKKDIHRSAPFRFSKQE